MAALLAHKGARWVGLGWSAFIAENVILSENRQAIVDLAGEDGYFRFYGSLSTLCLASTAYGYAQHARGQGPRVFAAGPGLARNSLAFALQAAGLVGLSQMAPPIVGDRPSRSPEPALPAGETSKGAASPAAASSSGGGCPVPQWLRGSAPKPDDHCHSASATPAAPETPPQKAEAAAGAKSGGGCPVPAWALRAMGFGAAQPAPAPADPPPPPAAPAPASGGGCPVPQWLRGSAPKPQDRHHSSSPPPAAAKEEPAAEAKSGCPVPGWALRFMGFGKGSKKDTAGEKDAPPAAESQAAAAGEAEGWKRVTRHPLFWSLGLVGLGSAAATPFAAEAVMWAGPAAMALVGTGHQDSRHRRGIGGQLDPAYDAVTSNIPFVALLEGRQSWSALAEELHFPNAHVALVLASALAARRAFFIR